MGFSDDILLSYDSGTALDHVNHPSCHPSSDNSKIYKSALIQLQANRIDGATYRKISRIMNYDRYNTIKPL